MKRIIIKVKQELAMNKERNRKRKQEFQIE